MEKGISESESGQSGFISYLRLESAIALNIREPDVARFYVEYWKLRQLYSLNKIYEEIKDDIGPFVRLYTLAKVARMDTSSVIRVLEIGNNDLPLVEHKCERLKREVDDLEANKHNSARILQEISDQITIIYVKISQRTKTGIDQATNAKDKTRRPCR